MRAPAVEVARGPGLSVIYLDAEDGYRTIVKARDTVLGATCFPEEKDGDARCLPSIYATASPRGEYGDAECQVPVAGAAS